MPLTFTKVSLPFGWLGNMSPYPVVYAGLEWRTTEHLFQALRFDDPTIREEIRHEKSPFAAKLAAKGYADLMAIEPMGAADLANMELCLRLKLDRHPELKDLLLATGNEVIVEDVTNRGKGGRHLFWGMACHDGVWIGENSLGRLWMKLREELRPGRPAANRILILPPADPAPLATRPRGEPRRAARPPVHPRRTGR